MGRIRNGGGASEASERVGEKVWLGREVLAHAELIEDGKGTRDWLSGIGYQDTWRYGVGVGVNRKVPGKYATGDAGLWLPLLPVSPEAVLCSVRLDYETAREVVRVA